MPDDILTFLTKPRTMIAALRQNPTPNRFLRETFFKNQRTHTTESVDIDIVKTKRLIAQPINPISAAKVVEREGFVTMNTKPAYFKEKIPLRVKDLLSRQPGETIYDAATPEIRAAAIIGEDLRMLEDRFVRGEELMCAQALFTGKIELKGEGVNSVVDFGYIPNEHEITLSGTSLWDSSTADPQKDMDTWRRMIVQRSGLSSDIAILGSDAAWAVMDNPKVKDRLDNRRIEMGQIAPSKLPRGVTYLGNLLPAGIDMYSYDEWYVDPSDGIEKPIVPGGVVLLGSTASRCEMNYGLIQNMKYPAAVPRFPSSWMEDDGSARWLQLESAPLPNLYQADAFLVAHVL